MVTYYVDKDEIYKVSATVNCAVYDASGSTIATCDAGLNVAFKAPTSKIMVSDDNAALTRLSESSGGSGGSGDFAEHMADSNVHVTPADKAKWNKLSETEGVSDEDRVYWNSKLNPSAVYEPIVINPLGTQEDNANAYGFVYVIPRSGYVTGIDIYCRTSGQAAPYPTTITRVKVWRGNGELLGTSKNYPAHVTGTVQQYTFNTPFYVKKGEELRVSFHTGDNWGVTEYTMGIKECCMATVALTSGESGGILGSDGNISDSSYTAKHYWYIDAEKFTPFEHSQDTSIHITAADRNNLNTLSNHISDDSVHVTQAEKENWNNAAPKNYGVANAVLITDADGNIVASTVISVSELNTLNNNLTNISTKLSNLESRITALES